jgi:hypothetical protein
MTKAYELLATPDKWTKGTYARDGNGGKVPDYSEEAKCWCVSGAIWKCYRKPYEKVRVQLDVGEMHRRLLKRIGEVEIPLWNDAPERTHAEVIAVLKELDI